MVGEEFEQPHGTTADYSGDHFSVDFESYVDIENSYMEILGKFLESFSLSKSVNLRLNFKILILELAPRGIPGGSHSQTLEDDSTEFIIPEVKRATPSPTPAGDNRTVATQTSGDHLKLQIPYMNIDAKGQMIVLAISVCAVSLFCLEKATTVMLCITKRLNNRVENDEE